MVVEVVERARSPVLLRYAGLAQFIIGSSPRRRATRRESSSLPTRRTQSNPSRITSTRRSVVESCTSTCGCAASNSGSRGINVERAKLWGMSTRTRPRGRTWRLKQGGELVGVVDEVPSTPKELLAIRCQANRARRALQEAASDVSLERSNRHRHARLGQTEVFGRSREARQLCDLHEHSQGIDLHTPIVH
jgi:hypothetical protein